jgi:hypothetical protein
MTRNATVQPIRGPTNPCRVFCMLPLPAAGVVARKIFANVLTGQMPLSST